MNVNAKKPSLKPLSGAKVETRRTGASGSRRVLLIKRTFCSRKNSPDRRLVRDFVGAYRPTSTYSTNSEVYTMISGYGCADAAVLEFLQKLRSTGALVLTGWKLVDRKAQAK